MTLDGYREIMRASAYDVDAPDGSRPISMTIIMNDTLPDGYDEHTLGDSFDAAGTAMLDLLGTLASAGDRYHDLLVDWSDSRIRKVVKHARAAKFERARAALVDHGCPFAVIGRRSATALVIAPLTEAEQHDAPWFHVIHSLQLHGYHAAATVGGPMAGTLTTIVNDGLDMTAGKSIAQYLHSVQIAVGALDDESYAQWAVAGYRLSVAMGSPRTDDPVIVHDAGFTEIAPGSFTASAKFTPSA